MSRTQACLHENPIDVCLANRDGKQIEWIYLQNPRFALAHSPPASLAILHALSRRSIRPELCLHVASTHVETETAMRFRSSWQA